MTAIKKFEKTDIGIFFRKWVSMKKGKHDFEKYDDYTYICKLYRKLGRECDLKNPKRYTEKLQWLKLFYRNDLMPICSDKYEVRNYIKQKGYGDLLNELIEVYENVDEIDIDKLPERCVIKASHGSGWNLIVKDKKKVNWFLWKKIMKFWMNSNLFWYGREWNYQNLKPRIIVERYLEDDSGELRDYKIICSNGRPLFMQIDENRSTNHKRAYVDCDGKLTEFQDNKDTVLLENYYFGEIQKKMFTIAEDLCQPFPFVRVDFYECNGKIFFGELTFFGASGFFNFNPDKWDIKWGELIELPEANNNIELLSQL